MFRAGFFLLLLGPFTFLSASGSSYSIDKSDPLAPATTSELKNEGDYAVGRIPAALLKNANAVLRAELLRFEIKNVRQTITTKRYAITILNANGDAWAAFTEFYNHQSKIISAEGALYDASGKLIRKVKRKDMEDLSAVSGANLIDDSRIRKHNFHHRSYPYTVEYIIEKETAGTLFFPAWIPQGGERLSVVSSSVEIVCPTGYTFRHKAFNYEGEPAVKTEKNSYTSTWSIKDMPALTREPLAPLWHELTTAVIFGPTDFQMENYTGNMGSWQDFGKFIYALKENRDQLPETVKRKVSELTAGVKDPVEKIDRLYRYMQQHTRYISIQLGIGGWQPFPASEVASKGYGDCKALSNYMYSLLKEAGIRSYYTLVRAGSDRQYLTTDFPSQQFNHVILCVPVDKDTVWLECTSQTLPTGYLGDHTDDRYALLVDEQGGKLVRTPTYGVNENLQRRLLKAELDENGNLTVRADTRYGAIQQDNIHHLINHLSQDRIKQHLQERLNLGTYQVDKFEYKEDKSALPFIDESLEIRVNHYATVTGRRLFIVPNIMTRSNTRLRPDTARKNDIGIRFAYRDVDSVEIRLPPGYKAESIPPPFVFNCAFGSYNSSVELDGDTLRYYRQEERNSGRFSAQQYAELLKFQENIYAADRNRVVLVRTD